MDDRERDLKNIFGDNWINANYSLIMVFFTSKNIEYHAIHMKCSQRSDIWDYPLIALLLNIEEKTYREKAVEYEADMIENNPYWLDKKKCEQFMEYLNELKVGLDVMKALSNIPVIING